MEVFYITSYSKNLWVCPVCHSLYDEDFLHCEECGEKGEDNDEDFLHCEECGEKGEDKRRANMSAINRARREKTKQNKPWLFNEKLWQERVANYKLQGKRTPYKEANLRVYYRKKEKDGQPDAD